MFTILKSPQFLVKQIKQTQLGIKEAIEALPAGDTKKLKGYDLYRLRIGTIRVIYNHKGEILTIFDIGYRGDVYK